MRIGNSFLRADNSSIKARIMSLKAEYSSIMAKVMLLEAENSSTKSELVDFIEKLQVYRTLKTLIHLTDAKTDIFLGPCLHSILSTPSYELSQRLRESTLSCNWG
jgi:hypothetical protein